MFSLDLQQRKTPVWVSEQRKFLSTVKYQSGFTATPVKYEPRHEKTCLRDFRPGKTEIGLLSYEASQRLEISYTETRGIILSRQRITKALIRLRGCAG